MSFQDSIYRRGTSKFFKDFAREPIALALGLAVFCLLEFPAVVRAESTFPRGPGFYFSLSKLLAFLVAYFVWISLCKWVDHDTRKLELPTGTWNPVMLSCGVVGIVLVWFLPWFIVSYLLLVVLILAPSLVYASLRNQRVGEEEMVLTERHLKALANRYFKLKLQSATENEEDDGPNIRFLGKSDSSGDEHAAKIGKAAGTKGYKAAREMVYEALQLRCTDIHMEPTREEMTVRFRIDGTLQTAEPFGRSMGEGVINIFKVLADMDITEKRKPQDGSFSAEVDGRVVDFRVATAGSVLGEKLVMRVLDKAKQIVSLSQIGMRERLREQVRAMATQPHGMFIVCGPTGSGKSTTLYACLNEIDRYQKNIITIENPVEYQMANVTQIEVNPKAGKNFASELRSILRQDPDVIMIGEIRDQETAEIACQAAQTGHFVFTTLHANDTVTALFRLLDLGVQGFAIANSVSAILGQRLVRMLCPKCKVRYKPNMDMVKKANLPADKIKHFCRPPDPKDFEKNPTLKVCENCGGTGYRGRIGIFEFLIINDRIRELIRENPSPNAIKQEAIKSGLKFLQEDGLRQVIEGKTSVQELLRVSK